ncbi:MAG: J domain-containing protein [Tatlockia sp.]|nr:J domain-containing protein [Tatlockia sp.]
MKDFYKELGLEKEATLPEIKYAYRKMSLHAHPDRGGKHERMQILNEAYETLSDPVKRRSYHASWDAAQSAEVEDDSPIEVSGSLRAGNTPPYSYAFRKEHKALVEQYFNAPLKTNSAKEREPAFESKLYQLEVDGSPVSYPHLFALLDDKQFYSQNDLAAIPQENLTPKLAVQLFSDFLSGSYYGIALLNLIDYFSTQISQTEEEIAVIELYESFFDIIALAEMTIEDRQSLIFRLKKITDFAKGASDTLLASFIPLFTIPTFAIYLPMR